MSEFLRRLTLLVLWALVPTCFLYLLVSWSPTLVEGTWAPFWTGLATFSIIILFLHVGSFIEDQEIKPRLECDCYKCKMLSFLDCVEERASLEWKIKNTLGKSEKLN